MTTIDINAPLRSLIDAARADGRVSSQADLGDKRKPPVKQGVVGQAIEAGPRIKLSTLAAYARAAEWRLWVAVWPRWLSSVDAREPRWRTGQGPADDLDVTVAGARALLAALGLEMSLAIEPAEEAKR